MSEVKIIITIPDLAAAIDTLAAAIAEKNTHTVCNQYGTDNKHIDNMGILNMDMRGKAHSATPAAPVNPTHVPTVPTQTHGIPTATSPAVIPAVPAAPVATAPVAAAVPTAAPQYNLDMLALAGSSLIDAGKMEQLIGLLGKFGVASITELPPDTYGAVATELRALGAAI